MSISTQLHVIRKRLSIPNNEFCLQKTERRANMPTKIGGGHQMQEYDPATGRYGYGSDEFANQRKTFLNHSTGFKAEKKETERMAAKESPYKGGSPTHHSLRENIQELSKIYPINEEGYFSKKGEADEDGIRQIDGEDAIITARRFYETLAYGGIEENLPNGKGVRAMLKDGTFVIYREITSTPGSPAVEINIRKSKDNFGIKYQKIHFEKKGI